MRDVIITEQESVLVEYSNQDKYEGLMEMLRVCNG